METRRFILALLLATLVTLLWFRIFPPPPIQEPPQRAPEQVSAPPVEPSTSSAATADPDPLPAEAAQPLLAAERKDIVVRTETFTAVWDTLGARLKSFRLVRYVDDFGDPLELVDQYWKQQDLLPFAVLCPDSRASARANQAVYVPNVEYLSPGAHAGAAVALRGDEQARLTFSFSDGKGDFFKKAFLFSGNGYTYSLEELKIMIGGKGVPQCRVDLGPGFDNRSLVSAAREKNRYFYTGGAVFKQGYRTERTQPGRKAEPSILPGANLAFAGLESTYFCLVAIAGDPLGDVELTPHKVVRPEAPQSETKPKSKRSAEEYSYSMAVTPGPAGRILLYHGPKEINGLKAVDPGLIDVIAFGRWLGFFEKGLLYLLNWIFAGVHNYGIAVIGLSLLIKIVFYPFTKKSFTSMQKMKKLQPQIKAIQDKYKGKAPKSIQERKELANKKQAEMMKLYQEEGMPQLGGCLPMLLQMPVLFAMYRLLGIAIELRQAPFVWWIKDLSVFDPTYITPIVMGGTMFIQQLVTPSSADPRQKRMMMMLPLMFTFFFVNFPAGLVLYWLTNNVVTIVQQSIIDKQVKAKDAREALQAKEEKFRLREERRMAREAPKKRKRK